MIQYGTRGGISAAPAGTTVDANGGAMPTATSTATTPVSQPADSGKHIYINAPANPSAGTMNADLAVPGSNAPKVPAPVVMTSDAATKNLANIKAQVDKLAIDVANHKAALAGNPPAVASPQSTAPVSTQGQPSTVPPTTDEQITTLLNGLTGNATKIDTATQDTLDPLTTQATALATARDDAATTAINQLNRIASGTYPLSPTESALLDSTKQTYLDTIQGQQEANASFTGQMTELAASLGINTSAPTEAIGLVHAAISQGQSKVADLNGKMAQSLATLSQGFQKDDFDMVQSAWQETAKFYDDRLKSISGMQKAVTDAAEKQKSDQMDMTKFTISTMLDSEKFSHQEKQDTIDNAFKSRQITETQRHDLQTELHAKATEGGTDGGTFTKTQLNKGAANAAVDVSEFSGYPSGVKNYYINNPTQAKAFNQLVADRQSGKTSSQDIANTIATATVPDDVKEWMYTQAGVDANGNPTDGKKDSGITGDLSAAGDFLGNSYDDVKNWLGIQ